MMKSAHVCCIALLLGFGNSAVAGLMFDLTGSLGGEPISGFFELDPLPITGSGTEVFNPSNGLQSLSITIALDGQTYVAGDDLDFPTFPQVALFDGAFSSLNFIVQDSLGGTILDVFGTQSGTQVDYFPPDLGGQSLFTGSLTVRQVSLPATAALLFLGLLGLCRFRAVA